MAIAAVSPTSSATAAFGLDFQSLMRIILTQLTYQDPLKPLDNFQFVSQLGQFAQLQQSQAQNDQITQLPERKPDNPVALLRERLHLSDHLRVRRAG